DDPVVTDGGRHLEWTVPVAVPASGVSQLHFGVNAPTLPGDYFNRASATAPGGVLVNPTGDTALVSILGPAKLSITPDRITTPASPASIATGDIPMQPRSPYMQSAPVVQFPLLSSPVVQFPLLSSPVVQFPLLSSPVVQFPLLSSPVVQFPLLSAPLGFDSLVDPDDLGSSPAVGAGLAGIPLSAVGIVSGDDWATRLAGTSLADEPLQGINFGQALSVLPAERTPSLAELDLANSPLGRLTSFSFFMGDTRLRAIGGSTFGWCGKLEALGHSDCGAALGVAGDPDRGLSASLLSLEIAGVNLDEIAGLRSVRMSEVDFPAGDEASLPAVLLSSFDLEHASVGGTLVNSIPAATRGQVVNCGIVDCGTTSTTHLHAAKLAGALVPGATIGLLGGAIGALTVQEVVLGTFPGDTYNPYALPAEDLGILGYGGAGAGLVNFHVELTNPADLVNPTLAVTLPSQFRLVLDSSVVKENGVALAGLAAPTVADELITFSLPNRTLAAGKTLTIDFGARPGLEVGALNASVTARAGSFELTRATTTPITVTEHFEAGDTVADASPITPGQLNFGHLNRVGDVDYFTVAAPAQAGSKLNVYLTCECDADLIVYHPSSSRPHDALRPPAPGPAISTERDQPLTLATQGEPLVPGILDDIPFADLPLAASSANRGEESEYVEVTTWDAAPGALYTIQVSNYNISTSATAYGLRATLTQPSLIPPVGDPRSFAHDGNIAPSSPALPATFDNTKTLVIADSTRLRRAYGDERAQIALDALDRFAAAPQFGAKVLFLDGFADVQAAFDQLDSQPSNPELSNDVVRLINARVDTVLGAARSGLQFMVLIGTDEILPMSRLPDLTETANERTFAQDLVELAQTTGGNNALLGAASQGKILSDDPYGAFTPRPFLGTQLYVPDVALGRLVESPEDMESVVNQALTPTAPGDAPGVLRPQRSLVTGYDFMTSLADGIAETAESQLTPGKVARLIGDNWTADDLAAAWPKADPIPDIISPNGHYAPNVMQPADASGGLFSTEAFGGPTPPDLAKRLIFQMGCHSGFSISNELAAGSASDWPEATLGRGAAAFIGQTGFGIGLASTLAFSAELMNGFAKKVDELSFGWALTDMKQSYASTRTPNVYDYKIMAEATYFGLPMFRLAGAQEAPAPAAAGPAPTPDPTTGLLARNFSANNPVGDNWVKVTKPAGSYYALKPNLDLAVSPNRPVMPSISFDAKSPNVETRGAMITALRSVDELGFDPLLARPVIASSAETEHEFSDIIHPAAVQNLTGGPEQKLVIVPAQFHSEGDRMRRFTRVDARVFYAPANSTDRSAPIFRSVRSQKNGSIASYKLAVDDLGGGSVVDVAVLFHDISSSDWTFRRLARAADGTWVGGFPIVGSKVEYLVQAVDSTGNVAVTTNKGDLFETLVPSGVQIEAAVNGADAGGWYADPTTVTLNGPEGTTFLVSDNGGPATTWASGQPIPVSGSGIHTLHYVAQPSGVSGDITIPIDATVPTIVGSRSPDGNEFGWNNAPVTVSFACSDEHSGVATCEADRTLDQDGAGQSVTGRAVDAVGNAATVTVGGINIDRVAPTITGAPTTAANAAGYYRTPVTVRFSCADDRSGVVACPADVTLAADGMNQSVTRTVTDKAGNSATYTVSGINIDQSLPTSDFNSGDLIIVIPGGPISGSASDALSGVASVLVSFRNNFTGATQQRAATLSCNAARTSCTWTVAAPSTVGVFTSTSVATDRAGNAQNPGATRQVQVIS
ncbi:MAG TPA: hypothetical protein VNB24_00785, partial [Acidimicrobiales bacterium]|nr:hypothetical protein [Acidimicrobiales bacterium]